ncbi:MAG TPA: hypothetical protein VFF24_08880 [Acidimicrobiia bacterium]|nr:hypothetical protein [Acidimicrobiia bacterium]
MCPSDEELAAIVAAVEVVWPRPASPPEADSGRTAWRFSGRWWLSASPVAAERRRP